MMTVVIQDRLVLCTTMKAAFWDGKEVKLSPQQYALVEILVASVGVPIDLRDLYSMLRARGSGCKKGERDGHVVMMSTMRHIRKAFKAIDPAFGEIETSRNKGYLWRRAPVPLKALQAVRLEEAA